MSTGSRQKEKTVLIIEDEADIRGFIARVLELEGYRVLVAGDGKAALEMIKDYPVALVLLDLRLPGTDGWAILKKIKCNPDSAGIPVVVLTAIAEAIKRKRTLRMGASSYLVKPLSARSLSSTIAETLRGRSRPYRAPQRDPSSAN